MIALIKTNNPVTISFATALLSESDIFHFVQDTNVSILEGSIGIIPRRLMVRAQDASAARQLLIDGGLEKELLSFV